MGVASVSTGYIDSVTSARNVAAGEREFVVVRPIRSPRRLPDIHIW